jgi:hypothetical protein
MREAKVDGKLVVAAPDAPETGVCPSCGAEVERRYVTRMDGTVTYFYRHALGQGKECLRRYHPTRQGSARRWERGQTAG